MDPSGSGAGKEKQAEYKRDSPRTDLRRQAAHAASAHHFQASLLILLHQNVSIRYTHSRIVPLMTSANAVKAS
jgi:hypothetical protein